MSDTNRERERAAFIVAQSGARLSNRVTDPPPFTGAAEGTVDRGVPAAGAALAKDHAAAFDAVLAAQHDPDGFGVNPVFLCQDAR